MLVTDLSPALKYFHITKGLYQKYEWLHYTLSIEVPFQTCTLTPGKL